jgi:hypothetical protein
LKSIKFLMGDAANGLAGVVVSPVESPLLAAAVDRKFIQRVNQNLEGNFPIPAEEVSQFEALFQPLMVLQTVDSHRVVPVLVTVRNRN